MIIKTIKQLFETQTTLLKKKAGIYNEVEPEQIPCDTLNQTFYSPEAQGTWGDSTGYTGIPAPEYLSEDPWFPDPIHSEKQMTLKEAHEQAVADQQILDESESKESADIHQKLYEMATKNWNTVEESQGGSDGWQSGTGYGQFRS